MRDRRRGRFHDAIAGEAGGCGGLRIVRSTARCRVAKLLVVVRGGGGDGADAELISGRRRRRQILWVRSEQRRRRRRQRRTGGALALFGGVARIDADIGARLGPVAPGDLREAGIHARKRRGVGLLQ